ncbi:hypothetical protein NL108_007418 [Boleophthalmus pectinirostris]|uniref:basic salivary proline-rich protein 4-like n=1 Tax=Boleophthalmus pectinirostris TaxID=150288 RepID=UPI002432BA85|nr:basic salivary proline-rich protein 4-like [Boleophthalmus pectinirostris]KAJ0058129.1 hypothetical protein NL108_007418 [Boleophthalmus pectinirostris]
MAPGFFLWVVLLSVLLLPGSIGRVAPKSVYRFLPDKINLHDEDKHHGEDKHHSDVITSDASRGRDLAFDDGSPIQPVNDEPPHKPDNSENQSPQGSNTNDKPATYPRNVHRFFYRVVPDQNSQSGDKPITFPMKPSQQSQGGEEEEEEGGRVLWPVPPSAPHPYNSQVPQGASQPPSNAWYSLSPVGSNPFYGVNNRRPQFYNVNPSEKVHNYGGAYNRPVNNVQQGSPPGYSTNTQTANIPAGSRPWFYTNYGPVDYKNLMHVPKSDAELSIQPNPHTKPRNPVPRYVIQARNGYVSNRYMASKMSYDPDV